MERRISHITYQDFSALVPARIKSALLPVGTMEAHGCTNLGTDITIPEYLCSHLAEKMNMLIAPAIPYGITRTLLPYPGSMTISPEAFEMYVSDVIFSLFRNGFENVIVINGHGGHYEPLQNAAKRAWTETGGRTLVIHWWELCAPVTEKVFGQAGGHAGIDETAMVMAADSDLVKPEQCEKIRAYLVRKGSYPYPNPAPMLIYKDGEGEPVFDVVLAKKYADSVVEFLANYIDDVLKMWENHL